jgi:hypothetical protein
MGLSMAAFLKHSGTEGKDLHRLDGRIEINDTGLCGELSQGKSRPGLENKVGCLCYAEKS